MKGSIFINYQDYSTSYQITFMIGNGFDKNLGLKTGYEDFLSYYTKEHSSGDISTVLRNLKDIIANDTDNWANLEMALGQYTEKLNSLDELYEIQDHIIEALAEYLKMEERKFEQKVNDTPLILYDLKERIYNTFVPSAQENSEEPLDFQVKCLNFNYTRTVTEIFLSCYSTNSQPYADAHHLNVEHFHIHGTLENDMLLGVDNASQIANKALREPIDDINYFIKPSINAEIDTNRHLECMNILENSDVIYLFGLSLGETDAVWWNKITQLLLSGKLKKVYISHYDTTYKISPTPRMKRERTKEAKDRLFSHSAMSEEEKLSLMNKVLVTVNEGIFDCLRGVCLELPHQKPPRPLSPQEAGHLQKKQQQVLDSMGGAEGYNAAVAAMKIKKNVPF